MISTLEIVFWTSAWLIALTYAIYPLTLLWLPRARRMEPSERELPDLTLVISAYNEAAVIRQKLENSLQLDYPRERLSVAVISDASTDGTDAIVRSFAGDGVMLCRQEPRGGKSLGLTTFVPRFGSQILVFSDANSIYAPDALRKLARHFADPHIGYVVGHQRYTDGDSLSGDCESLYWRYETWLKKLESRCGSVVGGDGAIFAIRSELFTPLRHDDINDFVIPLRIVAGGYRGVFDPEAVCFERTAESFAGEFRRKIRIVSRSLRAVARVPAALNPLRVGQFAYQLLAHKVVRWFVPVWLAGTLASAAVLAGLGLPLYQLLLLVQLAFYGLALLGLIPRLKRIRPVSVAYYFCLVNLAAGLGILATLTGRRFSTWTPQRRPESGCEAVSRA